MKIDAVVPSQFIRTRPRRGEWEILAAADEQRTARVHIVRTEVAKWPTPARNLAGARGRRSTRSVPIRVARATIEGPRASPSRRSAVIVCARNGRHGTIQVPLSKVLCVGDSASTRGKNPATGSCDILRNGGCLNDSAVPAETNKADVGYARCCSRGLVGRWDRVVRPEGNGDNQDSSRFR